MDVICSPVSRHKIDGMPTISALERIHGDLWRVNLQWSPRRVTRILAMPQHAHTPMKVGARVRVEFMRSEECAVYILS